MGFGKFSTHLPNYKTRKLIVSNIQVLDLKIADQTSATSEFSMVIAQLGVALTKEQKPLG
jgi:hypothetical protein